MPCRRPVRTARRQRPPPHSYRLLPLQRKCLTESSHCHSIARRCHRWLAAMALDRW
ncbi:MAG: hypothetical protein NZ703_04655 [Gemmataceae bacterium]|nr:hypothetical protein [Gemmataceae bacterium]MCS7270355.1 hypothetical protein [Gemmataceae bacterium]MDW8242508.1 hypothetical protein [Thermogemmata sp.]